MRYLIFSGVLCIAVLSLSNFSEGVYPQGFFRSPIEYNLRLAGTFGELRSNHFHAGIDIKSPNGSIGAPIVAAGDGYVSRIIRQAGGYGNALYIKHPNGYTTVYGHLDAFADEIEAYVKQLQYQEKSFSIDVKPPPNQFVYQKGERIGKMGNRGSSGGPHLHFEIRHTESGMRINPLLFGLEIRDNTPPRLHQLKVYTLDEKRETRSTALYDLRRSGSNYRLRDTLRAASPTVGFGLKAYDQMDNTPNWNGIYSLSLYQDDSLLYHFTAERLKYEETLYLNAHLDYREQRSNRAYFNRTFRLPGNQLSMYDRLQNEGVVQLLKDEPSEITLVAEDLNGNASRLRFWVRRTAVLAEKPPQKYNYFLPYDEESMIDNGSLFLHFPQGSFYENVYLDYQFTIDRSDHVYSAVHHIHEPLTPIHHSFELGLRPTMLPEELWDKAFIAYCTSGGSIINMGGAWKNDRLFTQTRTFGDYCIMADTIPPTIEPINFNNNMRGRRSLSFAINDNLPTSGLAQSLHYRATVDGRWILLETDSKTNRITHYFDDRISPGKHQLRLEVTDAMGNTTLFEEAFLR